MVAALAEEVRSNGHYAEHLERLAKKARDLDTHTSLNIEADRLGLNEATLPDVASDQVGKKLVKLLEQCGRYPAPLPNSCTVQQLLSYVEEAIRMWRESQTYAAMLKLLHEKARFPIIPHYYWWVGKPQDASSDFAGTEGTPRLVKGHLVVPIGSIEERLPIGFALLGTRTDHISDEYICRLYPVLSILADPLTRYFYERAVRAGAAAEAMKRRLVDLTRTLLHGYRKSTDNFPTSIDVVSTIEESENRRHWSKFLRYAVESHSARLACVDAASRGLMEADNPLGFLQKSWLSCAEEVVPKQWPLFLNVVAHGCLLAYVGILLGKGLRQALCRVPPEDLEWIVSNLQRTACSYQDRQRDYFSEVFERMAGGLAGQPRIEIRGHEKGLCHYLVLPKGLERHLGICWTLVFGELIDDMLKEDAQSRTINIAPGGNSSVCEIRWLTNGLPFSAIGSAQLFCKGRDAGKWDAPLRPLDEAGSGWGHYGNYQFVQEVMGTARFDRRLLIEEDDVAALATSREIRKDAAAGGEPQQLYQLMWEQRPGGHVDLATRIMFTAPSISRRI